MRSPLHYSPLCPSFSASSRTNLASFSPPEAPPKGGRHGGCSELDSSAVGSKLVNANLFFYLPCRGWRRHASTCQQPAGHSLVQRWISSGIRHSQQVPARKPWNVRRRARQKLVALKAPSAGKRWGRIQRERERGSGSRTVAAVRPRAQSTYPRAGLFWSSAALQGAARCSFHARRLSKDHPSWPDSWLISRCDNLPFE
jgi:hypothetical protein